MNNPIKRAGFAQGIHAISATAKEKIGIKRILEDGRVYRYAKAGSAALSAGKMGVAAAVAAVVVNKTAVAAAVGTTVLTLTIGSATYPENYFRGGQLQINDAAGEGHAYQIGSSSAVAAGTSIVITLESPIVVALTTSSEFTLTHSPWMAVTETDTEESLPVGVAPVAVTAAYYYWAQTSGPSVVLCAGTPAVGSMMTLAAVAGAVGPISGTLDIDQPIIGVHWGTVGVDTEYKPIFLKID